MSQWRTSFSQRQKGSFVDNGVVYQDYITYTKGARSVSELRKRYIQDLRLRNYSPKTIQTYVECVSLSARYFRRSPEELGSKHIRAYQIHFVEEKKCSWSRFNQTVCALRFHYRNTLRRDSAVTHIPFPRKQKKLPLC
jgi:site-specific recombinase XerD